MTYAIAEVVVGMEMPDLLRNFFDERDIDYEETGWKSSYSGNGIMPVYSGIVINEFDECDNCTADALIKKLTPTPAQWKQGQEKMNQTRKTILEFLQGWDAMVESVEGRPPEDDEKITPEEIQELMDSLPIQAQCLVIWGSS